MQRREISRIAVIGAGLMGHGIALEFAMAGYEVRMHDVSSDKLDLARRNILNDLQALIHEGLVTKEQADRTLQNLRTSTVFKDAVAEADVAIEAVFEDLQLKREIFRSLDLLTPPQAILASNTSSLLPSRIASSTHRPDKVLVAHYFNPPYLLPLVELVRHEQSSDETVDAMYALLKGIGKTPVIVQKEVPGFIGNRLQAALFREALAIVQRGIASPQDVDAVIKNSFGRRLATAGVFEVWEIAGWDLIAAICRNLFPDLASSREIPSLLTEMVSRGELGVKTEKGFYEWTPESIEYLRGRIARTLITLAREQRSE